MTSYLSVKEAVEQRDEESLEGDEEDADGGEESELDGRAGG